MQILDQRIIYNLCLVNKAFNSTFTPLLYAEVKIIEGHHRPRNPPHINDMLDNNTRGNALLRQLRKMYIEKCHLLTNLSSVVQMTDNLREFV
jgi:hypothetical protein